jgi:drug/metabolite transporter (DMT)-like permease
LSSHKNHPQTRFAEFVLVIVAIIFGVNPPAIKLGLQFIPPQPFNVARFVVACVVALIALWLSGSHRRPDRADLWKFFKLSLFGFFAFQILFTEGILRTTSGNASFMMCLLPLVVLVLNKFYGLETITRAVVVGIVSSLTGIALIVVGSGREVSLASNHLVGTLMILVSQYGYAYYTVFSKELLARYSTYQVTAYLMIVTTALLAVAAAPGIVAVDWLAVPPSAWGSVLFSGILALCVGNFLWIWGTGIIGTSRVAIFNNLSPVFAVITAYFLLGETFGPLQAAGAAFVFAGVYITRNRDRLWQKNITAAE